MFMAKQLSSVARSALTRDLIKRSASSSLADVLRQVQEGTLSVQEAEGHLLDAAATQSSASTEQTLQSFANLDHTRAMRTGFPEVVFAQGKTTRQLAAILDDMARHVNEVGTSDDGGSASTAILATR